MSLDLFIMISMYTFFRETKTGKKIIRVISLKF